MKKNMNLPLAITDADGRILYKSRSVKTGGFLRLLESVLAKGQRSGLVVCEGRSCYVSRVLLSGKEYVVFTDCEKISENFKEYSLEVLEELFDLGVIASDKRKVNLEILTRLFADACRSALLDEGVRISVNKMARDIPVFVSPRAFVFALAILARLAAISGDIVSFNVCEEFGRIRLSCDSVGGKRYKPLSKELLEILLFEVASAGGFEVEKTVANGKEGYMLKLVAADTVVVGLKTPVSEKESYVYAAYINMFL